MKQFSEKLSFFLRRAGMLAAQLSSRAGITEATISRMLNGKSGSTPATVRKIAEVLKLSESETDELVLSALAVKGAKAGQEWFEESGKKLSSGTIGKIPNGSADQTDSWVSVSEVDTPYNLPEIDTTGKTPIPGGLIRLRVIVGLPADAALDAAVYDKEQIVSIPEAFVDGKKAFAFSVQSDEMSPKYERGEVVVVEQGVTLESEDIVALWEYCREKGYSVEHVFEEVGSGLNDNRAKLMQMMKLAEEHVRHCGQARIAEAEGDLAVPLGKVGKEVALSPPLLNPLLTQLLQDSSSGSSIAAQGHCSYDVGVNLRHRK